MNRLPVAKRVQNNTETQRLAECWQAEYQGRVAAEQARDALYAQIRGLR